LSGIYSTKVSIIYIHIGLLLGRKKNRWRRKS